MSRAAFGESSVSPRLMELRKIADEIFARDFPSYTEIAIKQGVLKLDDWVRQREVRIFNQKSRAAVRKKQMNKKNPRSSK